MVLDRCQIFFSAQYLYISISILVFLVSYDSYCFVALHQGAVGYSVEGDCDIY